MKLINVHGKHVNVELELHLRDWKDATIWAILIAVLAGSIIWRFK